MSTRPEGFHTGDMRPAHFVQFFEEDAPLINAVSRFVCQSIDSDCTCLVVATAEHRTAIHGSLMLAGLNVRELGSRYQYIALDAKLTLSSFMLRGEPDQERFHHVMGLLVHQAASRGKSVRIFGEMVALLAESGQVPAALRLEELWNELSRQYEFTLFCAYRLSDIDYDPASRRRICSAHSYELPADA